MIILLLFFGLTVLAAAAARWHDVFLAIALLMLFGFAALRYGYGNDYANYHRCYLEIIRMGGNPFPREWLFTIFNWLSPHFYWLIALTSLAFVLAIGWLIKSSVPNRHVWLSFALLLINPYLFLMHLSAIRQCMALVCFVLAVPHAARRRPLPYALLVLAACGFHISALILCLFYFVANDRPVSRTETLLMAAGTLILLCSGDWIANLIADAIKLPLWGGYRQALQRGLQNSLRATLLSSVTLVYLLWNLPRLQGKTLIFAKLWTVGALLSVLAFKVSMLTRVEMYFDLFSIAAFPRMFATQRCGSRLPDLIDRWLFPALIIAILLMRCFSFFTNPLWQSFCNYRTILTAA